MGRQPFSIMVHGGAGSFPEAASGERSAPYLSALAAVLEHGREILARGGGAVDAVESCVARLEDDPLFNAGRGSVLNELGATELDAGIMDGRDLAAGAVAAVSGIANPIRLARRVMDRGEHLLLAGEGALRFADLCGIPKVPEDYFLTPERIAQFESTRPGRSTGIDQVGKRAEATPREHGTVGAAARDIRGDLAAATSTGGTLGKRLGRIGDTPIVGAGVFADNETCAVSATGRGEDLMRAVIAKTVADLLSLGGGELGEAVHAAIAYLRRRIHGEGGLIAVDREGRCASGFTTAHMIHGWIEHGGETRCRF